MKTVMMGGFVRKTRLLAKEGCVKGLAIQRSVSRKRGWLCRVH